jgi:hypothetical protein
MAEIASFAPREYPHRSYRGAEETRLAVAIATSSLPSFESCHNPASENTQMRQPRKETSATAPNERAGVPLLNTW